MKKRYFYILIFIISILLISEYHIGRLNIGIDQLKQYSAAKSLYMGDGLIFKSINYDDLSKPTSEVLTSFPPGYSVQTAPLFYISNNIRTVNLILSGINLFIFIFGTYRLANLLLNGRLSLKWKSLLLFFLSINATFIILASGTDLVCVNLFILATLSLIKAETSANPNRLIAAAALCMVLTVYFRYAYLPALFVIPTFFLLRILIFRLPEWRKFLKSILWTLIFGIPFIGHIIYINTQTQYVQSKGNTLFEYHWENLISVSPFPLQGFFDIFPFLRAIGYASEHGYDRGYDYPYFIDILFYLGSLLILVPVIKFLQPYFKKRNIQSPVATFGLFGSIISVGLVALIYFGSLINPSHMEAYNWSWAKIFRYFALPVFIIQMAYFMIIANHSNTLIKKFALAVVSLSLFYGFALKTYNYTVNYEFFNFEHNIRLLGTNDMASNSYEIHKTLSKANTKSNSSIALIDQSVVNQLYNPHQFLALNNCTAGIVGENFSEQLHSSNPINIYILTDSASTNTSKLIRKYQAKKIMSTGTNVNLFYFQLEPSN